jgi:hypothetical protein
MRAFGVHGVELQLGLADVPGDLAAAVEDLGFERMGAVFARRFPGDAPYATGAVERFEEHAERMVYQAARVDTTPWRRALEEVVSRAPADGWFLAGSAALAVRGVAVEPRDVDLVAFDDESCAQLAAALEDVLVEPLVGGGRLGECWFRAFSHARIECVGGPHASHDKPHPSDFGPLAIARLATVRWRGWDVRVPPLELQLASRQRRGLM